MTDKIRNALDAVQAEDSLKENTLLYLRGEIQKRKRKTNSPIQKLAFAFASCVLFLLLGIGGNSLYSAPSAYIDMDVNPSVELTLNRFDRVIGLHAYNADGENVLAELSLKHKNYAEALILLLEAMQQKGYIQNDELVSVTLQTDNSSQEYDLLTQTRSSLTGAMAERYPGTQMDVFAVSADTRSLAQTYDITPARYLAIQELMAVDPTASIEGCRGHSLRELRQQTQACMGRGGGMGHGHHMGGRMHRGG